MAAVALVGRAGVDACVGAHHRLAGCGYVACAVQRATHQHGAATRRPRCVYRRVAKQADSVAQHPDVAAALAGRRATGIELARDLGDPASAAVNHDAAVAFPDGPRLNHAFEIEHGVGKAGASHGAHFGSATVGFHAAEQVQSGLQAAVIARVEEDQPVAFKIELHIGGGEQSDTGCFDSPAVCQLRRHHHHTALRGGDQTFADDVAGIAATALAEREPAGEHVLIGDRQGAGKQTTDINNRVLTKKNATRVDQPDRTIGLQFAQNLGGIVAEHTVDQHRTGSWLAD